MAITSISFSRSETYDQALNRAADLFGIEREYWDIWGQHHVAPAEGISAVLGSLDIDAKSTEALDQAVENRLWEEWSRLVAPTLVASIGDSLLTVRVPRDYTGPIDIDIRWEDGGAEHITAALAGTEEIATASLRGQEFVARRVPLPFEMRLGYHELRVSANGSQPATTRWIVCPDRAYFPDGRAGNGRAGGISVSLYGVRSNRNWGCGDFTDLATLVDWVAGDLEASFIGLNPLHALANRQPYNTSPYLPLCSFYKNLIYLDLEAVADFGTSRCAQRIVASARVQAEIQELRDAQYVEYERVQKLKLRVLKVLFRSFLEHDYRTGSARSNEFRRYIESEGDLLHDFAVYCTLDATIHRAHPDIWLWSEWPAEYRSPDSAATRDFADRHWRSVLFFKYIQWQLDIQLAAAQRRAKERGLTIGLYHDLALATDRFGADHWAHRRFYVDGCRVGVPPDDFSPDGQDWSFPPPNTLEHYHDGYRLFTESLRKNLRHGGALRIDHVMRFFHLFWIPDQMAAKRGIYVRDRHEDLIRILALESVRNQVLIVGEDLGTVADEIRETLAKFGILSYRLFYFERHRDGSFKFPHEYAREALVSASTHDLPTLAGFWKNRDIEARRRAGLFPNDAAYEAQIRERMGEKQKILDLLFDSGLMPNYHSRDARSIPELTGSLHHAIVGFLSSTPSALMLLSEEDLMKQEDQQNLPGTTAQYPNWRHKTRFTLEELGSLRAAKDFSRMYRDWLGKTGRTGPTGRRLT